MKYQVKKGNGFILQVQKESIISHHTGGLFTLKLTLDAREHDNAEKSLGYV